MNVKEYKDIPYGPYERNKLDAYILDEGKPTPVLIFFHGGGYVSGDKSSFQANSLMEECLQAGISVVTCNYRFITTDPFPAPMQDGTRAIQFVRSQAEEWEIDAERIATSGSSAGGHIALWNALRGNLANTASSDPIERVPSNVSAFIGFGTQVSKDQRFYEDIYDGPHIQSNIALFYGISSTEELYHPDTLQLAEKASAINYMSASAPPLFMTYDYPFDQPYISTDAPVGEMVHHPVHGYILKKKYDEYQIPFVFRHTSDPVRPGEMVRFLWECFS
ncbi:alpha/beta hydrolase [Bacillus sp. SD088]|uniref:alpha/beta hydrolase n=1 Tax=Bacillus sp. SD088 TaxID=2782012 RepID=UPI001A9747A4|nr:alpha/beta hydrolase [Bacillus sp. SD088]MBO0993572.1 alpha/beta hydrolase [Bacillus sp. SD088]